MPRSDREHVEGFLGYLVGDEVETCETDYRLRLVNVLEDVIE
jgi:hypothetical protein